MSQHDDLRAEVEHLRHVILAAADDIEWWGTYASDYFQEKWDLKGDIARYRAFAHNPTLALIEEFHEPSDDHPPHCTVDGQAYPCAAVRLYQRGDVE
jgi:hypothetical protein